MNDSPDKIPILKRIRKSDLKRSKIQPEDEGLARRVLAIIDEGRADRYMQMFNSIPRIEGKYEEGYGNLENLFKEGVTWAIENLEREDRIIWYLRYEMIHCLSYIVMQDYFFFRGENPDKDVLNKAQAKIKELANKTGYGDDYPEFQRLFLSMTNNGAGSAIADLRGKLKHYLGIPSQEIKNYQFNNQTIRKLLVDLSGLEKQWAAAEKAQIKQSDEESKHEVVDLITFNDGWKWVLKNTEWCDLEAKAMGHCGNAGDPRPGDRVLSLREPTKKPGIWRPACTFILRKDGLLSEMKGRENDKPIPKYFPYIIELLKNDVVKGIVGGGYEPTHNFNPEDLPEGVRNSLYSSKPALMPIEQYLPEHGLDQYSKEMFKQRLAALCPEFRDWEPPMWDTFEGLGYFYCGLLQNTVGNFFRQHYVSISGSAKQIFDEAYGYSSFIASTIRHSQFTGVKERYEWWEEALRYNPDIATALTFYISESDYDDDYREVYEEEVGETPSNLLDFLFGTGEDSEYFHDKMDEIVQEVIGEVLIPKMLKLAEYIAGDDLESGIGIGVLKIKKSKGDEEEELNYYDDCVYLVNIEDALDVMSNKKYQRAVRELYSNTVNDFQRKIFSSKALAGRKPYMDDPYQDKMEKVIEEITKEDIWDAMPDYLENSPHLIKPRRRP